MSSGDFVTVDRAIYKCMAAVIAAARPCAGGCRRCDSFDRQHKLQDALKALATVAGKPEIPDWPAKLSEADRLEALSEEPSSSSSVER